MGIYVGDKRYAPYIGDKRRRYMGGGSSLPYDAEVEYLESTGTQYIDTGIACRSFDQINGMFQADGTKSGNNAYIFFGQGMSYSSYNFELYSAVPLDKISCLISGNTDVTLDYTDVFNVSVNNKVFTFADIHGNILAVADRSAAGDYTASGTMAIFALHRQSITMTSKPVKCFSFQISQDSMLVLDLIPVRIGTTGYMYDKVSGELFGNAGTGNFTLGSDKN